MRVAAVNHPQLWKRIESRLEARRPDWRQRIDKMGQVAALERRSAGETWTDDRVFKAIVMSVLSGNTLWSRIERIQDQLVHPFRNFRLEEYARLSTEEVGVRLVPWFTDRRAGSRNLRRNLVYLVATARRLLEHSRRHGNADSYFTSLMKGCGDDPKQVALRLGCPGNYKLPALGVPLAAEALKNLGYDVAKPDRHIMRAVASFGMVDFNLWTYARGRANERSAPNPTRRRHSLAMGAMQDMAAAVGEPVVFVDNAIWLLCERDGAESGLYLTNSQLAQMAFMLK